jgi:hypothetical protein
VNFDIFYIFVILEASHGGLEGARSAALAAAGGEL